jgi:GT2 family glycosyltransferase
MGDPRVLSNKRHIRLAIIYDNTVRPDTTGEYCRRALEALGHTVSHFRPGEVHEIPPIYDLYLRVDDDLDYVLPDALHPLAYWAIDTHRDYGCRLERARTAEWVLCAQQDGTARLRADGLSSAQWLPLACDPTVHRRIPGVRKQHDICFVGNTFPGDGNRSQLLEWIRTEFPRSFVGQAYGDDMARIYSASRIVFNCSIRNDVNMRVFEAAACGSLLMTNDLAENGQDLLFTPGAHLLTYQRREDLRPLIRQFLHDETERERMAEAGMLHAHAHHSYRRRMMDLLDVVKGEKGPADRYPVTAASTRRHTIQYGPPAGRNQQASGKAMLRHNGNAYHLNPQPLDTDPRGHAGRPRVSIIIPTFNNLQFTRDCIASIRGSTDIAYETIIVDNGSSDGTAQWARGEGLRAIPNPDNLGFPRACNQGIVAADGEYVVLLNNDTCVTPMWLERLIAHAEADRQVGVVGPSTNFAAGCQRIPASYSTREELLAFASRIAVERAGCAEDTAWLVGLCLLIPRRVVDAIGLLDERFGLGNYEDNDYCLRARIAGYRVVWAQDVFIHHAGHQSFKQLGNAFQRLLSENEQRFKRKWDLEQYRHGGNGKTKGVDGAWDLLRAERFRDAYEAFEAQVRANPADTHSLMGLGLAAEGQRVPAAAALAYRTILTIAPNDHNARQGLVRVSATSKTTASEAHRRLVCAASEAVE